MGSMKMVICGVILLSMLLVSASATRSNPRNARRVPALFVMGDSVVDGGTNGYIANSTIVARSLPYGETYFNYATGRFTNGRTIADFLAQSLGLPLVPPYLKPGAIFNHGANFASAGSGLLESTNADKGVMSLSSQLQQFHELAAVYRDQIGDAATELLLKNSVFLFAMGSNDIAGNYIVNSTLQTTVPPDEFIGLMLEAYKAAMKDMYEEGARKIVTLALNPLGCTPRGRFAQLFRPQSPAQDGCLGAANDMAKAFNQRLQQLVASLAKELPDAQLVLAKPSDMIMDAIKFPSGYGFRNAIEACCGAGMFHAGVFCADMNEDGRVNDGAIKPFVCPFPASYLFWDSNHPTEAAYLMLFKQFWYGDKSVVEPYNLNALFSGYDVPFPPRAP